MHLSFLETGRSQPSREMLLWLAELLEVPLRERNTLLTAAGFAPVFQERALGDPALQAAHAAVERMLQAHEPFPALAVDRHWSLLAANRAVHRLMQVTDATLLQPPINVLRVSLHPAGLAPHIVNLGEWREHVEWTRRHKTSQALALRARIVLACAKCRTNGLPVIRLIGSERASAVAAWRVRRRQ
jgi:transcriptional regulator with XRE-family HTH domain